MMKPIRRIFAALILSLLAAQDAAAAQFRVMENLAVNGVSVLKSSVTITGKDPATGYSLTLSSGVYTPDGTVLANLFIGDGSGLTNVIGTDNLGNHTATQDLNLSGFNLLNVSSLNFTSLIGLRIAEPANYGGIYASTHVYVNGDVHAAYLYGDGSMLSGLPIFGDNLGDHTATQDINANSFDLLNVSSISFTNLVGLSSATKANYGGIYSSTHVYVNGNVYAAFLYGDGSGLTNVTAPGDNLGDHTATQDLNMAGNSIINVDTMTVAGNAFSVGGSTLVVKEGKIGIGTNAPQAGLEVNNAAIFSSEYDNGNSGTALTINWTNGNKQKVTLTGNVTFTLSAPAGKAASFLLRLLQDGTGSRTVTWPAAVKWRGGVATRQSTAANAVDIVSFYYNGTDYYACGGSGYQ